MEEYDMVIGRILAGRYHILSPLGKGAFGHTYLAEDTQLPDRKRCVVKHLKPQATDELTLKAAKRLFNREAELLNKLGDESQQIPRLLAYFEENQQFYLVQELIEGHDLSQEIMVGKKLQETEVIKILDEVLDILIFVHQQNAIHRDIKPSNIMRRKQDGKLVLIDFGAVKEITTQILNIEGLTSVTVAIGTPGYMPSEQSQSRPKFASDIYSLGIMAIFALTGIDPSQIRKNPQTEEIIWRNETRVSNPLGNVIDKMVKYNFRERYQSAIEAKQALTKILPQPTIVEAVTTLIFKKPVQTQLITIGIVLLCSLSGGVYYYFNKSRDTPVLPLTYENIDYGIQMEYPDNWELEKIEDPFGAVARFYPRQSQGETVSVQVTLEVANIKSNTSLDEYTTSTISNITQLPEAKIISSQQIKLGKKLAHQVIYKNPRSNSTNKYLQVWLLEADRVYIITYVAPEDKYQDFIETVEKIMIPSLAIEKVFN